MQQRGKYNRLVLETLPFSLGNRERITMKVLHFKKTYLFAFGCISDALGGLLSSCGAWAQWFAAQGTSCLKVYHFPVAQTVKNLPAVRRPEFDPRVGKIPWRREWPHTPVFVPREFHEQRSLVG